MKLIASLLVKDELDRYLEPCIRSLLGFCDEVRVLDDGSTDGMGTKLVGAFGDDGSRVNIMMDDMSTFFDHEGRLRQRLFEWTLEGEPTHILAIDADEFISDGAELRAKVETDENQMVWALQIEEIWRARDDALDVRVDGAWGPHRIPCLYRAPTVSAGDWRIMDQALACGREPIIVRRNAQRAKNVGVELLHFGWTRESDRAKRYQRYEVADGGRFHRNDHLLSIMWPDDKVKCESRPWPEALEPLKADVYARTQAAPGAKKTPAKPKANTSTLAKPKPATPRAPRKPAQKK